MGGWGGGRCRTKGPQRPQNHRGESYHYLRHPKKIKSGRTLTRLERNRKKKKKIPNLISKMSGKNKAYRIQILCNALFKCFRQKRSKTAKVKEPTWMN